MDKQIIVDILEIMVRNDRCYGDSIEAFREICYRFDIEPELDPSHYYDILWDKYFDV